MGNWRHEYQQVPDADGELEDHRPHSGRQLILVALACVGFGMLLDQAMFARSNAGLRPAEYKETAPAPVAAGPTGRPIIHISDIHVDPLFDPLQSMQSGVCHTCNMSNEVYGRKAWCPTSFLPSAATLIQHQQEGYAFGRYGCNPPHRLWVSLVEHLKIVAPDPRVIVLTGDISPHGYPDDNFDLKKSTKIDDLCATKFLVTRHMVMDMVKNFPSTKWAFTMGNNDYFPKNVFWPPYIKKLGDMFFETGFFTKQQHDQFIEHGCNYIDIDNVRYLSIDFTVFTANGEQPQESKKRDSSNAHTMFPIRHKITQWTRASLLDAQEKGLAVWIVGHQPLSTKKGSDELDVDSTHYRCLKNIFTEFEPIIRVGLFGHRNQAGLSEVLSPDFKPLFPSLTAPGVSLRGLNQPSFFLLQQSTTDGSVINFEQHIFDLLDENSFAKKSQNSSYLGKWHHHDGKLKSWQTLTGFSVLTKDNLRTFLNKVTTNEGDFFSIETWKKAGYIGDDTPESYDCKTKYDTSDEMMLCLFPQQNKECFDRKWWLR